MANSGTLNGMTDFSYDGWQDIEEHNGSGALVSAVRLRCQRRRTIGARPQSRRRHTATGPGDQRLFYNQNTLYSVYALTDVTGKIIEAYQYDAYGTTTVFIGPGPDGIWFTGDEPRTASSVLQNPFTYTGQRLDAESGLLYYKNRYYSSNQGGSYREILAYLVTQQGCINMLPAGQRGSWTPAASRIMYPILAIITLL